MTNRELIFEVGEANGFNREELERNFKNLVLKNGSDYEEFLMREIDEAQVAAERKKHLEIIAFVKRLTAPDKAGLENWVNKQLQAARNKTEPQN